MFPFNEVICLAHFSNHKQQKVSSLFFIFSTTSIYACHASFFFLSKNDVSLHLPWDVHKIECSEWCGPIKIERFYVYGCLMTSKKAHTMKMERAFRLLFIVCPPEIRYKWKIPFRLKKGKIVNTTSNSVVMCCLLFL